MHAVRGDTAEDDVEGELDAVSSSTGDSAEPYTMRVFLSTLLVRDPTRTNRCYMEHDSEIGKSIGSLDSLLLDDSVN